jgi:hypothetical protein
MEDHMPWANVPTVQELRMQCNAALAIHSAAKRALVEAMMTGQPPPELVEAEARAEANVKELQKKLIVEVTAAITGSAASETSPRK